jgi:hypothetical protein
LPPPRKQNEYIDARKICDCLRYDFLPGCYLAPTAIRKRRRILRNRKVLVRQMVQMTIKISALLMQGCVRCYVHTGNSGAPGQNGNGRSKLPLQASANSRSEVLLKLTSGFALYFH